MTESDLPRPIPWLAAKQPGPVDALDGKPTPSEGAAATVPNANPDEPPQEAAPNDSPPKGEPDPAGGARPARPIIRALVWLRRAAQVGFLAVFLFLLAQTAFRGTFAASVDQPVRLPYPVEAFLLFDPFVAAMTLLSTSTVYHGLVWSLVIVLLTLLFGRVFCGWICPLGTLHHFVGWLFPDRGIKGLRRVEANRTKWWQVGKYYVMWASLGAALFGSAMGGLLDPICVAVRCIGLGVLPVAQYLGVGGAEWAADSNVRALQTGSDAVQDFFARTVWTAQPAYFHQAWLIVFAFVAIVFMNRIVPRFWCRALCPLGALLGSLSRFSLLGMEKDHARCTNCTLCLLHCQGADSPQGGVEHRRDECHVCFNCEAACPEDVIKFRFFPRIAHGRPVPDLKRRTVIASAAAGAAAVPSMRIANWPDKAYSEKVIRPPGAVEEREFLARCIRCAECMKVCPNNALHPAFFEAGLEGLWTPILIARVGYCELSCVLCGQVCPTGAIQKIDEKQRMGVDQKPIRIGTAMYDRGRCLPWAMAIPCIVCEEYCPTSPKAIWVEEVEVPRRSSEPGPNGASPVMDSIRVQRPHVDPSLCVGCGACEKMCPVVDRPAVYVTSAGETRSRTNVILLENAS